MSPAFGPGPVSEGFGGKTKGASDARTSALEAQIHDLKNELSKLHELRGSRMHSPEVLAYFEHLRNEKDAVARKALAEKRKLEEEIFELRRKCSTVESDLEAERNVARKFKAREADAQLKAEREAAARSQTADQRDETDRQLRALQEQRERESLSIGELRERIAQLDLDIQFERERAERAEESLVARQRSEQGESAKLLLEGGDNSLSETLGSAGLSPLSGIQVARSPPTISDASISASICGGLWHQKREAREGWGKLLQDATTRVAPCVVGRAGQTLSEDTKTNNEEGTSSWINKVLLGDFGTSAAVARGGGAVTIYLAGACADTKSERGTILQDVQPYLRRLARAVGLDLAIIDLAAGGDGAPLDPLAIDMLGQDVHASTNALSSDAHGTVGPLGGGMLVLLLGDRYGATVLPRLIPGEEFDAVLENMIRHEKKREGATMTPGEKSIMPSDIFQEMYEADDMWSKVNGDNEGKSSRASMILRLRPPEMPSTNPDKDASESVLQARVSLAKWRKGLNLAALGARKAVKRLIVKGILPIHTLERYASASTEAAAAAATLGRRPGEYLVGGNIDHTPGEHVTPDTGNAGSSSSATWRADLASAPAVRNVIMVDRTTVGINMSDFAASSHRDIAVDSMSGAPMLDSDEAYVADNSAERSLAALKGALGAFLPKNQKFESSPKWVSEGITVTSSGTYLAEMADAVCSMLAERILEGGIKGLQTDTQVGPIPGLNIAEEVAREAAAHGAAAARYINDAMHSFTAEQAAAAERIARYVTGAEGGGPPAIPLVLRAMPGGGISTVLANGLATICKLNPQAISLLRIVGLTQASSDGHRLIISICDHIAVLAGKADRAPGLSAALKGTSMPSLHQLQASLSSLLTLAAQTLSRTGRGPLILAIDGVQRISGSRSSRSLTWLPCSLPPNVRIIITFSDDPSAAADALRSFPTRMVSALSASLSDIKHPAEPITESFDDGGASTARAETAASVEKDRAQRAMAMSAAAAFMKGGAKILAKPEVPNDEPSEPELPSEVSPDQNLELNDDSASEGSSDMERDDDEAESDDESAETDVPIPHECVHMIASSDWREAVRTWMSKDSDQAYKNDTISLCEDTANAIDATIDAFPSCTPSRAHLVAAAARQGLLNPNSRPKRKSVPNGSAIELANQLLEAVELTHGKLLTRCVFRLLAAAEHGLSLSELGDLLASNDEIIRNLQAVDAGPTFALPQPLIRSLQQYLTGFVVEKNGVSGQNDETELMLAPYQPPLRRAPNLFISLLLRHVTPMLLRASPSDGVALFSWRSEDVLAAARSRYLSNLQDQCDAFTDLFNYFSANAGSFDTSADGGRGVGKAGMAGLKPLRLLAPGGNYHRVVDDAMLAPQPVAYHAEFLNGGCLSASGPTRPGLKSDVNLNRRKLSELPNAVLGLLDAVGVRAIPKLEKILCDFDLAAGMLATGSGGRLRALITAVIAACERSGRDPQALAEFNAFIKFEAEFLAQHPGSTLQQALNCPLSSVSKAAVEVEVDVATRAARKVCNQAMFFRWQNMPPVQRTAGATARAHRGIIRAIAYSHDGKFLATAGEDGAVLIHDAITFELESPTQGHGSGHRATAVAWSPSSRRLVSGGDDCFLRVWDPSTGDAIRSLDAGFSVQSLSFAQLPKSSERPGLLAVGGMGGRLSLWTTHRWLKVFEFRAHDPGPQEFLGIPALSWSPLRSEGNDPDDSSPPKLATCGDDGIVKVWDVSSVLGDSDYALEAKVARKNFRKALKKLERAWPVEEWSLGGWRLRDKLQNLFECEVDDLREIWANARERYELPDEGPDDMASEDMLLEAIKAVWDKDISPIPLVAEGREAFNVMASMRAKIVRPKLITRFKAHSSQVLCIAWSPGADLLASGGADGIVRIWNVNHPVALPTELDPIDEERASSVLTVRRWVTGVAFSPEGKRIVAVCSDKLVHHWACTTVGDGKWVRNIPPQRGHKAGIMTVSFAPDAREIATADGDGVVMKWQG